MFQVFSTMLQQMLGFFALMLVGFLLANRKILSDQARAVMSRLETYVFLPAIYFLTFSKNCTVKNLTVMAVDLENNLLLVKGAVPGAKNSLVALYKKG